MKHYLNINFLFMFILLASCQLPIANYHIISTYEVIASDLDGCRISENRVKIDHKVHNIFLGIPILEKIFRIGDPGVDAMITEGIDLAHNAFALINCRIYEEYVFIIPFVYTQSKVILEADPVIRSNGFR